MKNLDIKCLNIELTTRCTSNCPYCARVQLDIKEIADLKLDTLKKFLLKISIQQFYLEA